MSANNTEINLNNSGYAEGKFRRNLAVALNWPWERQKTYRQRCSKHGNHEALDLRNFSIERNGVKYVPRGDAVMSYCPDCLGDYRSRNIEFSDAPDEEVIEAMITGGRKWGDFEDGFEIAYLEDAGDLEYCPFCGEEFSTTNQDKGRVTCPEHGPLNLDVKQLREQEV